MIFRWFKQQPRPNIVWILMDQVRNDHRRCHPVFETLAREGVLFSEVITYAPYTIASLPAMLSGLFGTRNGVNAYYKAKSFDKERCFTFAQYLKESGYYTLADTFRDILIPPQGFDGVMVYEEEGADLVARHGEILRKLYGQRGRPFFAFLHYGLIHRDVVRYVIKQYGDFDDRYFGRYAENARRYEAFVREGGDYLDAVLTTVRELDTEDNTLIIVATDHGTSLGEKPGEKAYGVYTYDYSIKTWVYLVYPKLLPRNVEISSLVRTVDIVPTVLDLLGISPKKRFKSLDGESLLPLIKGRGGADREAFSETGGLDGPHPSTHAPNVRCVRTREWKLIYNTTTKQKELYDLVHDDEERYNVFGQYPEVERRLWERLTSYSEAD